MLVVVHDRDGKFGLESALNLKAFGCLDILQIDRTEGRRYSLDRRDEGLWIGSVDLNIKSIDPRIDLEKECLTLHDGLTCLSTDVAQTEDGSPIRDHPHEVPLTRIAISIGRALGDS